MAPTATAAASVAAAMTGETRPEIAPAGWMTIEATTVTLAPMHAPHSVVRVVLFVATAVSPAMR
jgi:hypothetical protein